MHKCHGDLNLQVNREPDLFSSSCRHVSFHPISNLTLPFPLLTKKAGLSFSHERRVYSISLLSPPVSPLCSPTLKF